MALQEESDQLRIAFLTPEYVSEPKFDGGLANYIFRITQLLSREGHEPEIFVRADRDETFWHGGILVHRCAPSDSLKRLEQLQRRYLRIYRLSYMDVVIAAQALSRVFSARHHCRPFDVVEASNFKATGLFVAGRQRPGLVTRISYLGSLWDQASGQPPDLDRKLRYTLEDRGSRRSDLVYGPCSRMAALVSRRLGRVVDVIHPPVFPSVQEAEEDASVWRGSLRDQRYVLFFGRICRVKGVDILARAMRRVLEADPGLRLVMVGRVESESVMREVRALLGNQVGQLIHLGRLPHRELFPIIRGAQFVVLPSRADNFPNSCVEAMLLGQVVIGTRETGFEDVIEDGVNGLLADPGDAEGLEGKLRIMLNMEVTDKIAMKSAVRRRISEMEPRQAVQRLLSYYEQAIQSRRRG